MGLVLTGTVCAGCLHRSGQPASPAKSSASGQEALASPMSPVSSPAPAPTSSARVASYTGTHAGVALSPGNAATVSGSRIGTVRAIGAGSRFVLLESNSLEATSVLTAGQELRCLPANPADARQTPVVLRVSRERRPPFVVADVISGEPQSGDEVYAPKQNSTTVVRGIPASSAVPAAGATPPVSSFLLPPLALPPTSQPASSMSPR